MLQGGVRVTRGLAQAPVPAPQPARLPGAPPPLPAKAPALFPTAPVFQPLGHVHADAHAGPTQPNG